MSYVDGFVLVVPEKNMDIYKDIALKAGKIWMEHGALEYKECVAEDMEDKGFCKTFPALVDLQEGEVVVFSYICFKSRAHRDQVNAKVMADPKLKEICDPDKSPFNTQRMSYGGFKTIVQF